MGLVHVDGKADRIGRWSRVAIVPGSLRLIDEATHDFY